jgi:hypothetical protein
VGSKPGVEPSSADRGNVGEGGAAHARLAVSLGAGLVVPARSTASRVCAGSSAPAPSGVRLQGCNDAHTWATCSSLIPSRRRLDDIPRIQLEFGEKSRAFWPTLSENRPGFGSGPYLVTWSARERPRGGWKNFLSATARFSLPSGGREHVARPPHDPISPKLAKSRMALS